ncbi:dimethylarginine dimethylaminohydrolase family protein [Roseicella sp. DB1501]|uniref:dimethylarginine dimethylaminohydrolase family protein n=1 Tax=Roseicella sp. DB1501 TaxID=2730925 RepID=UPI001491D499|nr:arginine deiminase-related protein [Roseicella sp. DB1501]NOG71417.1 amidinotransferase [Roseicella sp. DB1501]
MAPTILMTDPAHFEVDYVINPWMRPEDWHRDAVANRAAARAAWTGLAAALRAAGARLEVLPGAPGLPDMVFPANAAVVLDRRALLARFACAERRPEEARFRAGFRGLQARGLLDEVAELPEGLYQEGAGDCLWDAGRGHFWAGHGQRSLRAAIPHLAAFFGQEVVPLELVSPRFYHLDVCFCPLPGGELLYHPGAFAPASLAAIHERIPPAQRIAADAEEAGLLCLNAVALGRDLVMARTSPRLRAVLAERGYRLAELDLAPFILSGGAAFCMTLRLDRSTAPALPPQALATLPAG